MDTSDYRKIIDGIDDELVKLFSRRMDTAAGIAGYKKENGLEVYDGKREREKLEDLAAKAPPEIAGYVRRLYSTIFELSREYQNCVIGGDAKNIVLIGMPGCGKTTVGRELARMTGRQLLDSDEILEKRAGMSAAEYFDAVGQERFRREETEVLRELCRESGKIIATGGGCVTVPENYAHLHRNGIIILIRRDLSLLPREGRPLLARYTVEELYQQRRYLYEAFADTSADNNATIQKAAENVLNAYKNASETGLTGKSE